MEIRPGLAMDLKPLPDAQLRSNFFELYGSMAIATCLIVGGALTLVVAGVLTQVIGQQPRITLSIGFGVAVFCSISYVDFVLNRGSRPCAETTFP